MISVTELKNPNHSFYEMADDELEHHLENDPDRHMVDESFSSWSKISELWKDDWTEEDILANLKDWAPYSLIELMADYGFNVNKYGLFRIENVATCA